MSAARREFDDVGRPRQHAWRRARLITNRKAQEQRLEQLANYDELTGHFNKRRLREALDHIARLQRCARAAPGAYLAIGIDKLATINDAFGYEAADAVLIEIGRRLDRCLRVSDVIGRVGGDRFGIVLAHCPRRACRDRRREDPRRGRATCRSMTAVGPGLRHRLDRQRHVPRPGQDLATR